MAAGYRLIRSRRRSLALRLLPDGSVELRAPNWLPALVIELWFQSRQGWLAKARRQQQQQPQPLPAPVLSIEPGAWVPYLGQPIQLSAASRVQFSAEFGQLALPLEANQPERNQRRLQAWYKGQALLLFPQLMQQVSQRAEAEGLIAQGLKYRWMKRRWGSCSRSGWLTLNLELIKFPPACIELVIAHELCHLRHFDHGPEFNALLARLEPELAARQRRLQQGPLGIQAV